jgi:hypothetical protein
VELSVPEYINAGGKYGNQIYSGGDTWEGLLKELGLEIKSPRNRKRNKNFYYENLKTWVKENGKIPKSTERTKAKLNFSKTEEFWNNYTEFIRSALNEGIISNDVVPKKYLEKNMPDFEESDGLINEIDHHVNDQKKNNLERRTPPPPKTNLNIRRKPNWKRIDIPGMPYAPQDENAVIALFAILCSHNILKFQILDVQSGEGIDSICYDDDSGKEVRIEFKLDLSENKFNHKIEDLDMVVCWKNKWLNFPKKVIELENILKQKKALHR